MKIEYRHPSKLKPCPRNPQDHPPEQIAALRLAFRELGFDQPIVVDQHGEIIKGHGRWMAAMEEGLEEVPVIVRKISKNEARLLRAADNELVSREWDRNALRREMDSLSLSGADLDLTGFSVEERDSLNLLPITMTSSMEIPEIETTHECDKCGYQW